MSRPTSSQSGALPRSFMETDPHSGLQASSRVFLDAHHCAPGQSSPAENVDVL
ncbi:hypothetical protein PISMIDRAFT_685933, partial [Pisolithus microcarpus 441]